MTPDLFDAAEAMRVAKEMAEDDERAVKGPWSANHGSWSSNVTTDTDTGLVFPSAPSRPTAEATARMRNNAKSAAAQLRAAIAEVERRESANENLRSVIAMTRDMLGCKFGQDIRDVIRALQEQAELTRSSRHTGHGCKYCERDECDTDCSHADRYSGTIRRTASQWRAVGASEVAAEVERLRGLCREACEIARHRGPVEHWNKKDHRIAAIADAIEKETP